jgi:nifR3 family TIM-barrel protein
MFSNFTQSRAIIYAPMAGISDSPARQLARRFGADITVSELVAAEGVVRNSRRTWELVRFSDSERPVGVQIFGTDPENMAGAAYKISTLEPDFIDINFGCPARKVVERNGGSSILRDLKLLEKIVSRVVNAVKIPVTVKTRSGWDSTSLVYLKAGKIVEDCGAAAIAFHPRTKEQYFGGAADWSQIARLKENLRIPVIGNGDINSPLDAKRMLDETGCDAVMIGRGSLGNPWIFKRVKDYLSTGKIPPEPTCNEKLELAMQHLDMMAAYYGIPRGIYRMRSQFCYYLRGLPESAEIKTKINKLLSLLEIKALLLEYKRRLANMKSLVPLPA